MQNFARGCSVRDLMYHAMAYFPYVANDKCMIPDVDMPVCVFATSAAKTGAGNQLYHLVATRSKEWYRCPVMYLVLLIYMQQEVIGTHEVVTDSVACETVRGCGPPPVTDGKDGYYDWKVRGMDSPSVMCFS